MAHVTTCGRSVCHPSAIVPPSHTGDDRISEEEFALYFSKVIKVKVRFRVSRP